MSAAVCGSDDVLFGTGEVLGPFGIVINAGVRNRRGQARYVCVGRNCYGYGLCIFIYDAVDRRAAKAKAGKPLLTAQGDCYGNGVLLSAAVCCGDRIRLRVRKVLGSLGIVIRAGVRNRRGQAGYGCIRRNRYGYGLCIFIYDAVDLGTANAKAGKPLLTTQGDCYGNGVLLNASVRCGDGVRFGTGEVLGSLGIVICAGVRNRGGQARYVCIRRNRYGYGLCIFIYDAVDLGTAEPEAHQPLLTAPGDCYGNGVLLSAAVCCGDRIHLRVREVLGSLRIVIRAGVRNRRGQVRYIYVRRNRYGYGLCTFIYDAVDPETAKPETGQLFLAARTEMRRRFRSGAYGIVINIIAG